MSCLAFIGHIPLCLFEEPESLTSQVTHTRRYTALVTSESSCTDVQFDGRATQYSTQEQGCKEGSCHLHASAELQSRITDDQRTFYHSYVYSEVTSRLNAALVHVNVTEEK